jgi:Uma2 family endonuclease
MSTVDRRVLPPLVAGERLDRATFHERYEAMPPNVKAELIDGVVYMASPQGYEHGNFDDLIAGWIFQYRMMTPGLGSAGNATTYLGGVDEDDVVQPDRQLRIPEDLGGSSRIVGGFVSGPPEFVVEVAKSSRGYDLGTKKAAYERAGVREYLFVGVGPEQVRWFVLREGGYLELGPGDDGLYRSETFPGLWLDAKALFDQDPVALIAALARGLATPEHAAFAARLAGR